MARNEIFICAAPEDVFGVLSDPRSYGDWVVGSREIRAADHDWPAAGAAFDHSVGIGWLSLSDHTSVISARAPECLELKARARPLPSARVRLLLRSEGAGTRVTMVEEPSNRLLSAMIGPVGHWLMKLRNVEALRRLKQLAEGDARRPAGQLPGREATGDG
ncbi:MAG: hypothetical protein QOD66_1328 [Solirubrobacteraceae bacterium]|jgi:hypothetical protein|nr:hypothetical protein [Solirubrobacteraceae bacterium]